MEFFYRMKILFYGIGRGILFVSPVLCLSN